MHHSKLIKALFKLPHASLKRFHEFVYSPYFNKHEGVRQVVDIVLEIHPNTEHHMLSKDKLFVALFPGEEYAPQKVSDVFTYCYRCLEQFFTYQTYESHPDQQNIHLLSSFRKLGMEHQFEKTFVKTLSNTSSTALPTNNLHLHYYHLQSEQNLYQLGLDDRTKDKSIEQVDQQLDFFYLTTKLRLACEMMNRQNIVKEDFDIHFVDHLQTMIAERPQIVEQQPAIAIYSSIWLTLTDANNTAHYYNLIQLLDEHYPSIYIDELRNMYDYAQNYCIKKINTGQQQFLQEIFELYNTLLERNIIFIEGELSQWDYKNMVTVGTRLKEYARTEGLIHQYKERLPEADRTNAFNYNLANFYYSKKEFNKALELLRDVQYTDVYYSLGARSLLLKVYYEAEEYDPLYSLFDSFKIYLKRNGQVSEYQYYAHMNLVRLTKRITDLRLKLNVSSQEVLERELKKLKDRMETYKEVTNAQWVLQEIAALEKHIVKETAK